MEPSYHDETAEAVEHIIPGDVEFVEEEDWEVSRRLSRLSLQGSEGDDADVEPSENEEDDDVKSDANAHSGRWTMATTEGHHQFELLKAPSASLPGTPEHRSGAAAAAAAAAWSNKEYASETEARCLLGSGGGSRRSRRQRRMRMRELWLERAWQEKKNRHAAGLYGEDGQVVVVKATVGGGAGALPMDMDEVRACKDLGFDLPCDWTVDFPSYALSSVDTASSGGNSPSAGWRISSPGADPKDVKARLKVWAQAVALSSAARLSG